MTHTKVEINIGFLGDVKTFNGIPIITL